MTDGWRIDVDSADADRRIERLGLFLNDLRSFWPVVTRLANSWWRRQFETGGAYGGRAWPGLSPVYAARKARAYPGKPLLVRTGAMRRALSQPTRLAAPLSLTLIYDDEKLGYHQGGTARMPARPVIFSGMLPPQARAELDAAAGTYVRDLLHRI